MLDSLWRSPGKGSSGSEAVIPEVGRRSIDRCRLPKSNPSERSVESEPATHGLLVKPKRAVNDLAVFGGRPVFDHPLHVGAPNIGNRERLLARIDDLLDRRHLTNRGPYVQELEQRIADLVGVKHCIVMCNGTVALEIAIRALGMTGEVIVPAMTFIATAHALQWQQITPVYADIHPERYTLDPSSVERMITPRTTGIVGVHLWGKPADIYGLTEIARRHGLTLLFDAAHAFNCSYNQRMIGSFGDAEVFSFHATKFVNSFEGGAVVTNNDDLAERIRLMQNFGFAGRDRVIYIGTNGKMSEVAAAMGVTSLESLDEFTAVNYMNYQKYREELTGLSGLKILPYSESERRNYQYVIIAIDAAEFGMARDQLLAVLDAENVLARRYFYPGCHRMEPYRSYQPHAGLVLPETEKAVEKVLALPTGTAVSTDEISSLCGIIRFAAAHAVEIRCQLDCSRVLLPTEC